MTGSVLLLAAVQFHAARQALEAAETDLRQARAAFAESNGSGTLQALRRTAGQLHMAAGRVRRFPGPVMKALPVVGSPWRSVESIAAAGSVAVAAAGDLAAAAKRLPTSASTAINGSDLSGLHDEALGSEAALGRADARLRSAEAMLAGAAGAAIPQVSRPARVLRADLGRALHEIDGLRAGLGLLADLTDRTTSARLLILAQDSLELRPTGGYVGSYGVLAFVRGTVSLERYAGTEDLPPPDPPMAPPADLAPSLPAGWALSNANWWPDFPTSARTAAEMFRRQGGGQVDGVLALTEGAMARITGALGEVQVPGYAEAVVEDGFAERLVYEVELKRPSDTPRKKFLIGLAEAVVGSLLHLPAERVPTVATALQRSVSAGDVQLWFATPERQQRIAGTTVAGELPRPHGDFLLVIDSNLSASKANLGLSKHVRYRVIQGRGGDRTGRVTIELENGAPESTVNPYYHGYLRVYVPFGSELLAERGQREERAPDGPYTVLSQRVLVAPETHQVVTFTYRLPPAAYRTGAYSLTWVRQPGTPKDRLDAVIDGHGVELAASRRTTTLHARHPAGLIAWLRRRL